MKTMLWIFALLAFGGNASLAQNAVGDWQGTLKAGPNDLRVVVKLSMADDKLKGVFYSIDQRSPAIPVASVTREGTTVKMNVTAIGGTFEGKLNAEGNSIAGTWTQGGQPVPLTFARATSETAWAIPEPPPPPVRMAADAKPTFEVATIKPSDPNRPGKLFTVRGADVLTINTSLVDLITMAFDVHQKQIVGAPAWIETDKYDITARPDVPGQPNVEQMKGMLRKLLADRFQLKFHTEKKELSAYALTVSKTGLKIKKSEADPNGLPGLFFSPPPMTLNVRNATLAQLVHLLQSAVLDRPVVDQTGLTDKYDYTLKFTPEAGQMTGFGGPPPQAAADNPDAPPDLFKAMQEQLGLRLESTKAQVEVMAIEKLEKPSAN